MHQDNKPSIIPFRVNKAVNALNSLVKDEDYFVTESRDGYMCTVEYIALAKTESAIQLNVSVYDFNTEAKSIPVLAYVMKAERDGTYFFTRIRMAPGEKLNVKAMGAKEPVNVHVSGYYEIIP